MHPCMFVEKFPKHVKGIPSYYSPISGLETRLFIRIVFLGTGMRKVLQQIWLASTGVIG